MSIVLSALTETESRCWIISESLAWTDVESDAIVGISPSGSTSVFTLSSSFNGLGRNGISFRNFA